MDILSLDPVTLIKNEGMEDASSIMASLLYICTIYVRKPSLDLAKMALKLSEKLNQSEYAETELICIVSRRTCVYWTLLINDYEHKAA